jgi:hypothetical protein
MPLDEYRVVDWLKTYWGMWYFNTPVINEVTIIIVSNEFDNQDIILQKTTNFREWQRHRRPVTPCNIISPSGRENITATSSRRLILEQEFLSVTKYLAQSFVFNRIMEQVRNINHIVQCIPLEGSPGKCTLDLLQLCRKRAQLFAAVIMRRTRWLSGNRGVPRTVQAGFHYPYKCVFWEFT